MQRTGEWATELELRCLNAMAADPTETFGGHSHESFQAHITMMRNDKEWGTELELFAPATLLHNNNQHGAFQQQFQFFSHDPLLDTNGRPLRQGEQYISSMCLPNLVGESLRTCCAIE